MNSSTVSSPLYYNRRFSIAEEDVLGSAVEHLSAACIAQYLQQRPGAKAILTLDDGDIVNLPVYTLRRRNAIVANLPEAPLFGITV